MRSTSTSTAFVPRAEAPRRPIAVTLGDPAGIGPDITLMSWRAREARATLAVSRARFK